MITDRGGDGPDPGLVGFLVGSALILAFVILAALIVEGDTGAFDRRILLMLRVPGDPSRILGPSWFPEMIRDLTSLGSTVVLGLLLLGVAGYLALARKVGALALVLTSVLGGQVITTILKICFDRPRPDLFLGAPRVFTASFPSGHSMLSAVTYLTLGALLARLEHRATLKRYYIGVAIALTLIVGSSRIVLGVHWPTDVLGGWCLGASWALLCSALAERLQRKGTTKPPPGASSGRAVETCDESNGGRQSTSRA